MKTIQTKATVVTAMLTKPETESKRKSKAMSKAVGAVLVKLKLHKDRFHIPDQMEQDMP